jgi:ATP-binding cassette subfamily B protein
MFKLLKYLKKSIMPIIFIIILLLIQATCDLSLPEYTSKIVNIGIQQGGIENVTPTVIKESTYNNLLLFLNDSDRQFVIDNYKLLNKNDLSNTEFENYKKKYPLIESENLYELNNVDGNKLEQMNSILLKPLMIISGLSGDSDQVDVMKKNLLSSMPSIPNVDENTDFLTLISMVPEEQKMALFSEIEKSIDVLPENIIIQGAIAYIKDEYKTIGININKKQTNYILFIGTKMLVIALLSMVASIVVGLIGAKVAATVAKTLRSNIFKKVVSFSSSEMKKFSTASLITRSTNDIQQVQMVLVLMLRIVIYAPILGIGGILKVFSTNNSMAWIIGVAVGAILSIVLFLFMVVIPKFKLIQELIDKLNLVSREILTGISVIRAFSTQKHEEKRFDKANIDLMKTNLFVNRVMALMMPMMMFIMNVIAIVIVWNGAHSINNGTMQVGDMMAFIQYTMQIIMAFLMISMVSIMLPRASVSAARIDEVLETKNSIKDPAKPQTFKSKNKGYVEFKNVTFRYPDADADVLTDINFIAKPGETTAFIGSTGSGKSTIINLIPRFFDVTTGSILIDGVDIRNVTQHELRSKIGYVPQKGILFSGTIASNIKYGNINISDKEMKKASDIAQATNFISEKSEQFDSKIAQGGTNVSGGQKQRLSIARAIATKPDIYIFDDSFSALDYKTDATLRAALKKETKKSTVLIVAQRISTVMHAEQIIVLDDGKIVGIGKHEQLLKNCDVYKQIAESQLSKEELDCE